MKQTLTYQFLPSKNRNSASKNKVLPVKENKKHGIHDKF